MTYRQTRTGRPTLAWALIGFSPYVGEFVLGNQPITALPSLVLLAPMYGCGALLIREVARRAGAGWPTIVLFAAAYAMIEEGLVDQMLFNPGYLELTDFSGMAYVPGIGFSARLALDSIVIHTVWSICVPIAVIEAFDDAQPRPWLGRAGLTLTGAVFVLACVALVVLQSDELDFVATPVQFGATTVVILVLVAAAVAVRRRPSTHRLEHPAPTPRRIGLAAFAVCSGYWLLEFTLDSLADEWISLLATAAYAVTGAFALGHVARCPDWGRRHVLAVAAGSLLTYGWLGILQSLAFGVIGPLGTIVFTTGAIAVLTSAVRKERRQTPSLES